MSASAASIAASSSSLASRAASRLAEPSSSIRNWTSSASPTSSTRTRRVTDLRSVVGENGSTSGPFGSPGRERTRPSLTSTRSASRTVERLTPNCVVISRSLGSRSPGRSWPRNTRSSTCSTMLS